MTFKQFGEKKTLHGNWKNQNWALASGGSVLEGYTFLAFDCTYAAERILDGMDLCGQV